MYDKSLRIARIWPFFLSKGLYTESRECTSASSALIYLNLKIRVICDRKESEILNDSPSYSRQLLHLTDRSPILQQLLDRLQFLIPWNRPKLIPRRSSRHHPDHTQHLRLCRLRCTVLLRLQTLRSLRQRLTQQFSPLHSRQIVTSVRLLTHDRQITPQPHILMPAAIRIRIQNLRHSAIP